MWTYNYNTELCHWGIKGQKWGVRRFQNKNGSLTPEGKKRYSESASSGGNKNSSETVEQRKARVLKSHSAKTLYENKDLFSDKELLEAYNRLNTENNIKNMVPKDVKKGEKFVKTYVDTSKTIKSVVDASDDLYKSFVKGKKLLDTLMKKNTP